MMVKSLKNLSYCDFKQMLQWLNGRAMNSKFRGVGSIPTWSTIFLLLLGVDFPLEFRILVILLASVVKQDLCEKREEIKKDVKKGTRVVCRCLLVIV